MGDDEKQKIEESNKKAEDFQTWKKTLQDYLKAVDLFMLKQQTERTVFMTDFDSTIDDFYKSLALQFGYITIFAIYYPAVTVYAMFANLIHVLFLVSSYNFYTRRPLS